MKSKLILFSLFSFALLCSCNVKRYKANDTIPAGTDSSMMKNNDSGMNRGNPRIDTAMNHSNAVVAGDTNNAHKNLVADTAKTNKAALGQDSLKKRRKGKNQYP